MSGAPDLQGLTREQALALLGQPSPAPQPIPVGAQALPPIQGVNSHGQPLAGPDYNQGALPNQAQTLALLADMDPSMSPGEDVARSAIGGLQNTVAGLATTPRGLEDTAQALPQAGVDFLARHGVGDGKFQVPAVGDMLHAPGAMGLGNLVQGVVGQGAKQLGVDPTLARLALSVMSPTMALAGPSPAEAATALNNGNPTHTPQTALGRYVKRGVEMAPMLVAPGSVAQRIANVLVPAAASQAAQDAAPDRYKGLAAMAGAVLGGGGVAGVSRLAAAPQAAFGGAMEGVTTDQMQAAQALRVQAAQRGIQLTVPEAVQQVTSNGTGLGRLQRVVEGTKQGHALTAPYFARRPGQVSGAVTDLADAIAPPTTQPSMIGVRGQQAAITALDRARQTVNAVAKPDYDALANQPMDVEPRAQLMAQPSYQIALRQLRADPELGPTIAGLPDNSVAVVNAVKQRLGTMGEQAKGTPLTPGDNQLAGVRFGAKALADALARDASPQYANANDTVANLSQQYVDPLKAGPLGAMSQSAEVPAQTGALYPRSPLAGAPNETAAAVSILGRQAPGVAEDLTRQHILNNLDTSMRSLQGGQNQYVGAKLAVALAGSPEQAATLRSGVSSLPGVNWVPDSATGVVGPVSVGETHARNLDELLQALEATGKRQPPGSMTAFNASDLKDLHIAPFAQAVGRLTDPLEWGKGLADIINRANYRRNTSKLAEMLMGAPEDTTAILTKAQKASKGNANPFLPALLTAGGSR